MSEDSRKFEANMKALASLLTRGSELSVDIESFLRRQREECERLQGELAKLRVEHDALQGGLVEKASDSDAVTRLAGELSAVQRERDDLARKLVEKGRLLDQKDEALVKAQSDLRLAEAKAEQLEASLARERNRKRAAIQLVRNEDVAMGGNKSLPGASDSES